MRKLLFESVFRRPLTERAPSPDDAAVAELATALGQCRAAAARPKPVDPRGRCRILQRMRAGNSRAQQRLLRRRAVRPAVRRLAAPCRRPDGDGAGDEKHARGAANAPITRRPIRNGSSRSEIARATEDVLPAATRSSAASPRSSRSTCTFPAARLPPQPCCKDCWRCSNARTRAPLHREERYRTRSSTASAGGRSCSLS